MSKYIGAHQHLYGSGFWKRRRLVQLAENPMCCFCARQGLVTPARVADHVMKHGGDANSFYSGELQSLCLPCHERRKRSVEMLGYDKAIGVDGWPCDPLHPCFRKRRFA